MADSLGCDVVVLGMGTSGEDATLRLTRAGLDVIGVEAQLIGGECPYWACLPSKWMIRSANLVAEARRADGLVGKVDVQADWSAIAKRLRSDVTGGWDDTYGQERFESRGGRLIRGWGRVTGPRTIEVGDTEIVAKKGIVVATGSRPLIPPIPGLSEVEFWTNREAIEAEELPESLIILGGGAVGCELGQIFARFGVDVTMVEGQPRLLATEEPEVSEAIQSALAEDGIEMMTGVRAVSVRSADTGVVVVLDDGTEIGARRILVATGRTADASALGVESAGATVESGFVVVDDHMRAADGMWAIGDITGRTLLTEVALYQGLIAIEDILGAEPAPADYSVVPRTVFTDPEVGAVGLTEEQALRQRRPVSVVTKDLQATFRGWLHRTGNRGIIKLVVDDAEDRIVGGSVVGPHAGDVMGFIALAIQERVPPENLGRMIYAFPTFYGAVGEALGAYGRGVVRVLDPDTPPLYDDPV